MKNSAKKHIIVGMSGGVDSSVAAFLLKEEGHHVEGVFMKNWEGDDTDTYCPASLEMAEAQAVADKLGIELHRVNFAAEYWERVFTHFLAEYKSGRTPNPDILCNKEIKFNAFLNFAKQRGADAIATGHYARIHFDGEQYQLLKGLDPNKDQSYFLYTLGQNELSQSYFPIGHLKKQDVRDIAKKAGFKNFAKKDSTGICFIGERKFKTFLNEYLPAQSGVIETLTGEVIGTHDGLMFYTLGQRQGLKIGGRKNSDNTPWYVVDKNLARNVLIVAQGQEHPALYSAGLIASSLYYVKGSPHNFTHAISAKTRYRETDQACMIYPQGDTEVKVVFKNPERAVTPGQSVVFYNNEVCLGGGVIQSAIK